jgi:superfamily II DNA or RNA helicase
LALKDQWVRELQRNLPDVRVAQLGDGEKGSFRDADVLLSTVHSAAASRPVPPGLGLVVADEVHRYGAEGFATALSPRFDRRLGLTGTYERNDDGVALVLDPYFGGVVYGYQYAQAIDDGVVAPFHLALVATRFTDAEGREYARAEKLCQDARDLLIREYGYPVEWPFFFELVQDDARSRDWDEARACSAYLKGFAERRRLMAEASGKMKALSRVAPVLAGLGRALVFTETVEAALDAAERLGEFTEARAISGSSTRTERSDTLAAFRSGRVRVLCAPRILDEGIDVPEADLAIVVAASRTRRQMVQRMGRVIRLKDDGRAARIVILYVEGTPEDPATGGHEAFLDQVLDHAQSSSRIDGSDPSAMATWLRLD